MSPRKGAICQILISTSPEIPGKKLGDEGKGHSESFLLSKKLEKMILFFGKSLHFLGPASIAHPLCRRHGPPPPEWHHLPAVPALPRPPKVGNAACWDDDSG